MSIDQEFESNLIDISLSSVLESRNECLNKSEVWAILKETCIALKPIEEYVKNNKLKLDINCLLIDTAGNIKVEFEQYDSKNGNIINGREKEIFINSLGKVFKYILENFSDVDRNDDLFQFVNEMSLSNGDDRFSIHNIEIHSDRQLNGSSVDALYQEYMNSKRSDELSSAFQDSFFSSVNSDDDTDTDQSICITKDFDTYSTVSDGRSFDNSDESKYFVCLNQLWNHSLDPIFRSDHECLVFIYVLFKEMSNILLNEDNFKKCLCISKENVFLNPLGQMLLNFSLEACDNCNKENVANKYHDVKYINTVGEMLLEIIMSDHRIIVSDQIVLLLQKMYDSVDMVISEILHFCKAQCSLQTTKCRSALKCLFERWNHWFNIHLQYLSNLKHKYLREISTKNLTANLKPTHVKVPLTIHQLYKQNPSWISDLKFTTELSKPRQPPSIRNTHKNVPSAFRPYTIHNFSSLPPPLPNSTRIKSTTHFRPLVLTSESNSVYRSQDFLTCPLDVTPQYSKVMHSIPSIMTLTSSKTWRSMNQLLVKDAQDGGQSRAPVFAPFRENYSSNDDKNKSSNKSSMSASVGKCSSKVNLILDIIQTVLVKSFIQDGGEIGDRHLLGVADFALSLGRLSKVIFIEAMKQRFVHIHWTDESLEELYDIINVKDMYTPSSDTKTSTCCSGDIIYNISFTSSDPEPNLSKQIENGQNRGSSSCSSSSEHSESFEAIEMQCAAEVANETKASSLPVQSFIGSRGAKIRETINRENVVNIKASTSIDESSDISDYHQRKTAPVLPNKLQSSFSFLSPEDTLFYQQIFPVTLLCFPSTMAYANQLQSNVSDPVVNATKIQEFIASFQDRNRTIRFKFKELTKTIDLISKCDDDNKNDRKIKKQFLVDYNELQLCIESLILEEIKIETVIVEYHSLSLDTILEEIKSRRLTQSIVFSSDVKNFQNLQFIHPICLLACLFAKGAVSSGLMYDFFLVYREFYKPHDFIEGLKSTFENIERKLRNRSLWIAKARFRLLYIILCWIDGFFDIDISPQILILINDLVRFALVPYIKNANQLIDTTVSNAKGSKMALSIQFTALHKKVNLSAETIHNVNIHKIISRIDKNEKDKERVYLRSLMSFSKSNSLGNQDTFSILNISPKDLAICLTLIQQVFFNSIHPCHLLLYLRSLSGNDESILNAINNDRFPARKSLPDGVFHKEIRSYLLLSGQITHWATSEILLTTDPKLQAKIVKKLVLTCTWCKEVNNFATMTSIVEALTCDKLKWAPLWSHVSGKITKTLKDITASVGKLFNSTSSWPDGHESSSNALLSGVAFLPCLHAILVHLKMSSFGSCLTREGCLKWTKLRKLSKILDQIRLYKQFRYISNDPAIHELRSKLKLRIEHLTSISLDFLQSHNMLTQSS